ncbi:SIS domain-containing protein [uncultured Aeromicrobium sp.]|uniref:SIS domain-containing protein n=1 Tax=uncultured Aeromicrobium sp. TaxID=337820 RepID=UPI0025EC0B36|nr:sugar isomerase [uncultured Aeromicrobium sp.]
MTLTPGAHLEAEIASQPLDWLRSAANVGTHADLLPRPQERVAVIGCGTSLYMAQAYADLRERGGHGVTDAWTPTEARLDRDYDRIVAITRSGTTTEVLDLLAELPSKLPAVVITATTGSPVTELAPTILTPEVDEQSVVQTRFATTTLAMLRAHLGEDIEPVAEQAQAVLDADIDALGPLLEAEQITLVGRHWTNGVANEAALKLREAAQLWTESYSMMEYRHGPLSISAPGRAVWAMGDPVAGLADDVHKTGAHFENADLDAMADLVRAHRLSLARALAAGLDPDRPRNLTRSIVLS